MNARGLAALCLALLASSTGLAASPLAEGFKRLAGPQIAGAFAGRTFSDEVHFRFDYGRDGKIAGMSMGREVANTWRVAKDGLCVTDSFGEACYGVWRKGAAVRLVIEGSDVVVEGSLR